MRVGKMRSEKGFSLIESIVALAILGIVGVSFLGSLGTSAKATMVDEDRTTAECLARSQIEYIRSLDYDDYATEYPVDPTLDIPSGWAVPNPTAEALHGTEDGIQKITITIQRDGETIFSVFIYKVNRLIL